METGAISTALPAKQSTKKRLCKSRRTNARQLRAFVQLIGISTLRFHGSKWSDRRKSPAQCPNIPVFETSRLETWFDPDCCLTVAFAAEKMLDEDGSFLAATKMIAQALRKYLELLNGYFLSFYGPNKRDAEINVTCREMFPGRLASWPGHFGRSCEQAERLQLVCRSAAQHGKPTCGCRYKKYCRGAPTSFRVRARS